jgi:hypothetical protein
LLTRTIRVVVLLSLLGCATLAKAQSGSLYWAGGTATDSSSGPVNTLGGGVTYNSPRMGGFFGTVGGDVIFWHGLGVGGEISFRQDQGAYAGLSYRPIFYDINAVYQPLKNSRRITPEIQGGFGRLKMTFNYTPQFCLTYPQGCRSTTGQVSTQNYSQLHVGGGVRVYVYKGVFVRPTVDIHWVNDLTEFSSHWVPAYSVAVGYTIRKGR